MYITMPHSDVIFWLGVILIVLGIVFLPFKPPENVKIAAKMFGAEIKINTPAVLITLLGAALVFFPLYWGPAPQPA